MPAASYRVVGDPSYVIVTVCADCHKRHFERRFNKFKGIYAAYCLSCCAFTKTIRSHVDEWSICHAVESKNHKFGGAPTVETDGGQPFEDLVTRTPPVQDWYDLAHSEFYKSTERERHLKMYVTQRILSSLGDITLSDSACTIQRVKSCDEEASAKTITAIVGLCIEMSRPNSCVTPDPKTGRADRSREINRSQIATETGMERNNFYKRKEGERTLSPPLCRLIDEISQIIVGWELCI